MRYLTNIRILAISGKTCFVLKIYVLWEHVYRCTCVCVCVCLCVCAGSKCLMTRFSEENSWSLRYCNSDCFP